MLLSCLGIVWKQVLTTVGSRRRRLIVLVSLSQDKGNISVLCAPRRTHISVCLYTVLVCRGRPSDRVLIRRRDVARQRRRAKRRAGRRRHLSHAFKASRAPEGHPTCQTGPGSYCVHDDNMQMGLKLIQAPKQGAYWKNLVFKSRGKRKGN